MGADVAPRLFILLIPKFGRKVQKRTDGQTDGQTDGRTDATKVLSPLLRGR